MATCNWIFGRPVSLVGAFLIICTSCIGTAFGALPAGYVPATLLYQSDGVTQLPGTDVCGLDSIGNYSARQTAVTITEQTKEQCYSEVGASITFGAAHDCELNGYGDDTYNGVPGGWCAKGTIIWPSRRWHYSMIFQVATVLAACPLSDGTMDIKDGRSPPLPQEVPDNCQGPVTIATAPTPYYPSLFTINFTVACYKPAQYELSINATRSLTGGEVTYHAPAGPTYGHVLTDSVLELQLTKNNQPAVGKYIPLKSSRGKKDRIAPQPAGPTYQAAGVGVTSTTVSTRYQPGTSVITSAAASIATAKAANITWLPAKYRGKFLVTCYGVAHEGSKHDNYGPMVTMAGLSGKHHEGFLIDAKRQGTGYTLSGNYIQLRKNPKTKKGYWKPVAWPHTASGYRAKKDYTIAVDRWVIPMSSLTGHHIYGEVSISGVGDRVAQDTGGKIGPNHIDLYYGPSEKDYDACLAWGNGGGRIHTVQLESYVH